MTPKAFCLAAGLGSRFVPQTQFLPKPALPFFNLPQALYPAAILKTLGVSDFYYNSHHLAKELDTYLSPFFNGPGTFEKELLDSAGGIANSSHLLNDVENFWVFNGDSVIQSTNLDLFNAAYEYHLKSNSIASLLGVPHNQPNLSSLEVDSDSNLIGRSKKPGNLHFIGFYIFNKEIFNFINPEKSHILSDVLLKIKNHKVSVYNLQNTISWYETGSEQSFLNAIQTEAKNILNLQTSSLVYKTHTAWKKNPASKLEQFLKNQIWAKEKITSSHKIDFLCVPDSTNGDFNQIKNSVLGYNLNIQPTTPIENKVLIHPSQWT